jgi:hypothetical protein
MSRSTSSAASNRLPDDRRLALRQQQSVPLLAAGAVDAQGTAQTVAIATSPASSTTCSGVVPRSSRLLDNGRICLINNAAERALLAAPIAAVNIASHAKVGPVQAPGDGGGCPLGLRKRADSSKQARLDANSLVPLAELRPSVWVHSRSLLARLAID